MLVILNFHITHRLYNEILLSLMAKLLYMITSIFQQSILHSNIMYSIVLENNFRIQCLEII